MLWEIPKLHLNKFTGVLGVEVTFSKVTSERYNNFYEKFIFATGSTLGKLCERNMTVQAVFTEILTKYGLEFGENEIFSGSKNDIFFLYKAFEIFCFCKM